MIHLSFLSFLKEKAQICLLPPLPPPSPPRPSPLRLILLLSLPPPFLSLCLPPFSFLSVSPFPDPQCLPPPSPSPLYASPLCCFELNHYIDMASSLPSTSFLRHLNFFPSLLPFPSLPPPSPSPSPSPSPAPASLYYFAPLDCTFPQGFTQTTAL